MQKSDIKRAAQEKEQLLHYRTDRLIRNYDHCTMKRTIFRIVAMPLAIAYLPGKSRTMDCLMLFSVRVKQSFEKLACFDLFPVYNTAPATDICAEPAALCVIIPVAFDSFDVQPFDIV